MVHELSVELLFIFSSFHPSPFLSKTGRIKIVKPQSQLSLRTATNAVRTIFRQWKFGKTVGKQGDSYEIIVRTNICDRSIR